MAFVKNDNGDYLVDESGNFIVDDGATIVNWNPITEVNIDGEVDLTIGVLEEDIVILQAVGNPGEGDITWNLSGPDAADFLLTDNNDGTATLTFPGGVDVDEYAVTITATNSVGSDIRHLLIEGAIISFNPAWANSSNALIGACFT